MDMQNFIATINQKHPNIKFIFFTILVGCIALLPRLNGFSLDRYLWGEDGNIFFNQAGLGLTEFISPYAGYLHLYPRIVAWIAANMGLDAVPYIFFIGWLLAYMTMVVVIVDRAKTVKLNFLASLILVALISLQPHSGEVFFTLTNSQWFLGVALILYAVINKPEKIKWFEIIFLVIASLTGPFSVLLLPVLLIKIIIFKDFKEKIGMYVIIFLGALIQLGFFIFPGGGDFSPFDLKKLLMALKNIKFIFLGGFTTNWIVTSLAIIFGSTAAYVFIASFFSKKLQLIYNRKIALLLLAAAFIICAIALLKFSQVMMSIPEGFNAGLGGRYHFMISAVIFFALAIIGYHFKWARIVLLITLSTICFMQIKPIDLRSPISFFSLAEFSKYRNNLTIPINPMSINRQWHIIAAPAKFPVDSIKPITLDLSKVTIDNAQYKTDNDLLLVKPHDINPEINFTEPVSCTHSQYIGIEVAMWREYPGEAKIAWSTEKNFTQEHSVTAYYPQGDINAVFALENNNKDIFLRFYPSNTFGESKIKEFNVYCLPER